MHPAQIKPLLFSFCHSVYLCKTRLKAPLFSFFRYKILWLLEKPNMADREANHGR